MASPSERPQSPTPHRELFAVCDRCRGEGWIGMLGSALARPCDCQVILARPAGSLEYIGPAGDPRDTERLEWLDLRGRDMLITDVAAPVRVLLDLLMSADAMLPQLFPLSAAALAGEAAKTKDDH